MNVKSVKCTVLYNGKDISDDLSAHLISLDYEDKSEGAADELSLTLDDKEGLWKGAWYPTKGDTLSAKIGYDTGEQLDCGTFEIDEVELSGPPDVVSIRALATGIKKALRTKNSKSYEDQTLKQIAEKVAQKNGLTVQGEVPEIRMKAVTQHQETDLGFLKRIGEEYGVIFSVRDSKLIFTTIYDIEKGKAVETIDRSQISTYSLRDKTSEVYKKARVRYHNPDDQKVQESETDSAQLEYEASTSENILEIRTKAEDTKQAEEKAKAALYRANSRAQSGRLSMEGRPLLVAGVAFELTGLGVLSGKYAITSSSHRVSRSGGYTTDLEIKKVASVPQDKQAAKKPAVSGQPVIQGPGALRGVGLDDNTNF